MPHSSPDLLPLVDPERVGLPWHGLVRDGQLQTSTGGEIPYGIPTLSGWSSATLAVQHPLAASATGHTIANHAQEDPHHRWQDYALLSDDDRRIAGQPLIIASNEVDWLYCDSKKTWRVYYKVTGTSGSIKIEVFIRQRFGVLGRSIQQLAAPRSLGSLTFAAKDYAGATVSGLTLRHMASHSLTGATTVVNVCCIGTTAASTWPWTAIVVHSKQAQVGVRYLHSIVQIGLDAGLAGTGNDDGSGITANIQLIQQAPDFLIQHVGTEFSTEIIRHYKQLAAVKGDGTLVQAEYYFRYALSDEVATGDLDPWGNPVLEQHATYTGWISFSDQVVNLDAYIQVLKHPTFNYGYLQTASSYINDVPLTDTCSDPFTAAGISYESQITTTSESIELLVVQFGGFHCSDSSFDIKAIGKEGQFEQLAEDWSAFDQDITYDSVRGLITVGEVDERVVYV